MSQPRVSNGGNNPLSRYDCCISIWYVKIARSPETLEELAMSPIPGYFIPFKLCATPVSTFEVMLAVVPYPSNKGHAARRPPCRRGRGRCPIISVRWMGIDCAVREVHGKGARATEHDGQDQEGTVWESAGSEDCPPAEAAGRAAY